MDWQNKGGLLITNPKDCFEGTTEPRYPKDLYRHNKTGSSIQENLRKEKEKSVPGDFVRKR